MIEKVLVNAPTGKGKTYSIQNIDPEKSMLIQVIPKRLVFPTGKEWKPWSSETKTGSTMPVSRLREVAEHNDETFAETLKNFITQMVEEYNKEIIIIDDLVYVMTQSFMKNLDEKGLMLAPIYGNIYWKNLLNSWNVFRAYL